jgi:hypothetical protein
MRKKLKKAHEQSVDSLFGGGFGEEARGLEINTDYRIAFLSLRHLNFV